MAGPHSPEILPYGITKTAQDPSADCDFIAPGYCKERGCFRLGQLRSQVTRSMHDPLLRDAVIRGTNEAIDAGCNVLEIKGQA